MVSVVGESVVFGVGPDDQAGAETQVHLAQIYCQGGGGLLPLAHQELAATWKQDGVPCLSLDRRLKCQIRLHRSPFSRVNFEGNILPIGACDIRITLGG